MHLPIDISDVVTNLSLFSDNKQSILTLWLDAKEPQNILSQHGVDLEYFRTLYASGVFDYFIEVIQGSKTIGDCPVMENLLAYLKDKDISANELFTICNHFRKAMIDFCFDRSVSSKAMFDQISYIFDTNFAGVLKSYTDTIYQKEQEIAKNVSLLNEYKNALDHAAIVSKTDTNGVITYVNEIFCAISGFNKEELLGKKHNIIKHATMPDSFHTRLWRTIMNKEVFKGIVHNQTKEGKSYFVDLAIIPIENSLHETQEFIAIGYDVTNLIKAQQEAQQADQAKDIFLSSMSHEIRTPLNAILGFVSILLDEEADPKHKHYLDIINNSGENLLAIINDILDFSKLRNGSFTIDPKPFLPHTHLSHIVQLFAGGAYEKEIKFNSFIDPLMPHQLYGDVLRIKQIFSNLLSNAIKFTATQGSIDVDIYYKEGRLFIRVNDTGIGIAKEHQDTIFDAFTQITQSSNSTGLGLSISKQLATHMQGDITLHSTLGLGSTFELSLPLSVPQNEATYPFDPVPFQNLRFGFYVQTTQEEYHFENLARYFKSFALEYAFVTHCDEYSCDLLIVTQERFEKEHDLFAALKTPLILLQKNPMYDDSLPKTVTTLTAPIFCENIYLALIQALDLESKLDSKFSKNAWQRRFKGSVLVAEDNSANQELIELLLKRYGLTVTVVNNGKKAVTLVKKEHFDLLLMDEHMPVMSGHEASVQIKALKKEIPIIAVSANVRSNYSDHNYAAFLHKPILLHELETVLEHYLEERPREAKNANKATSFNAYEIDLDRLQCELELNEEEVLQLLTIFFEKMHVTLLDFKKAALGSDFKTLRNLAHSIKGSAANFRFTTLEIIARNIENAARAHDADYDYLHYIEAFSQELDHLQ